MQSSYNVIKSNRVIEDGAAVIDTLYEMSLYNGFKQKNNIMTTNDNENELKKIMDDAIKEANTIKLNAVSEVSKIKKEAYQKGYEEGYNKGKSIGYDDGKNLGYKEGYREAIEKAKCEAESIIENASNMLIQAKHEYEEYFKDRENDIKKVIIGISKEILKRELQHKDGLNSLILETIKTIKDSGNLVIRCNGLHYNEIKSKLYEWKNSINFKGEIFVLEDSLLSHTEAVIQKENGILKVDLEYGLEKIKEILMEL
ncbi:flagellar assembly protein H [Clostridium tepidiprofundi DSM 19306]|uniref:Flagellar assembly protein H n=1 Tax=Clostridium tepidiprofundi DSM 19306 TaxID=1121338 RepID=A0A151B594_9CLOT|nr:FliH/SctL family protein [Clostridium tepidiprofundi]KYH35078.1 flagellar assembly protein H [Clostridium tepidiprofundi DSM 19306]